MSSKNRWRERRRHLKLSKEPSMRALRATLIALPLLAGGTPPEDFLGVKEWWGSFKVTLSGQAGESGNDGGFLPWKKSKVIHRMAVGQMHLGHPSMTGVVPGRQPDMKDLMEKSRFRTWYHRTSENAQLPPIIVDISDSYEYDGTLPVEGKVVDKTGTRSSWSGNGTVKMRSGDQPMLVVDVKQKLYHLVLPVEAINGIKVTERTREWIEFWNNLP